MVISGKYIGTMRKEWMEMGGMSRGDAMRLKLIRLEDTEGAVEEIEKKEDGEGRGGGA